MLRLSPKILYDNVQKAKQVKNLFQYHKKLGGFLGLPSKEQRNKNYYFFKGKREIKQ